MVFQANSSMPDEYSTSEGETHYQTKYSQWNGLVFDNPVLRQIIEIRAASVFSSWQVTGAHEKAATKMLSEMKGRNGHDSFKQIMANMYRIAYICGDAYAEKIYDGNPEDGNIVDLHILPSDNIRQVIRKGKIIRFEETTNYTGTPVKWKPFQIFHIRYNPRGAMTHGLGMVEGLNNTLTARKQIMQNGDEMYERVIRPKQIIFANTDNKTKLEAIRDAIKAAGDSWDGVAVLPKTLIDSVEDITLNPIAKPQEWLDTKNDEIFLATATPSIMLGTGYANSEESLAAHLAGYYGSIRFDQEDYEENVRTQLFAEMWPSSPPEIEFSFTQEAFDAMFNRLRDMIPVIEGSQVIAPENKDLLIRDILKEMGRLT